MVDNMKYRLRIAKIIRPTIISHTIENGKENIKFSCPTCGRLIYMEPQPDYYCPECGDIIDWDSGYIRAMIHK